MPGCQNLVLDSNPLFCYNFMAYPGIAEVVQRHIWDVEIVRSSRTTRTKSPRTSYRSRRLFAKVTSHSFCCGSSLNRNRFAGLRFSFRCEISLIRRGGIPIQKKDYLHPGDILLKTPSGFNQRWNGKPARNILQEIIHWEN